MMCLSRSGIKSVMINVHKIVFLSQNDDANEKVGKEDVIPADENKLYEEVANDVVGLLRSYQ